MDNRCMKTWSTSLIIKEMQIRNSTIGEHHTLVRMVIIEKIKITSSVKDMEKKELLCTAGGNANVAATMENRVKSHFKSLAYELPKCNQNDYPC